MRTNILAFVLFLAATACGPQIKTGAKAAIDCAEQDLSKLVRTDGPTLLAETIGIVQAGGAGWRDALGALGKKLGEDALACSVLAAKSALSSSTHFASAAGAERASTYLVERGYAFASR